MIEKIFVLMWLADAAGAVKAGIGGVLALSAFLSFVGFVAYFIEGPFPAKVMRQIKIAAGALALLAFFAAFIPSRNTIYTYLALSVGVEVAEISGLNETAGKAVRLLNQKLDAELEADENR